MIWYAEDDKTYTFIIEDTSLYGDGPISINSGEINQVLDENSDLRVTLGRATDEGISFDGARQKNPICSRNAPTYLNTVNGDIVSIGGGLGIDMNWGWADIENDQD
jgi:hypothetical protein